MRSQVFKNSGRVTGRIDAPFLLVALLSIASACDAQDSMENGGIHAENTPGANESTGADATKPDVTDGVTDTTDDPSATGAEPVDRCLGQVDGMFCGPRHVCIAQRCVESTCGDGYRAAHERCDDGNKNPNDGCGATCSPEFCGDWLVQSHEECDDGNRVGGDGCSPYCRFDAVCGDGDLDWPESCDDGNKTPGDGCSEKCVLESCGDGKLDIGEECDDGNQLQRDGCSPNCLVERCGDYLVQPPEECDDGNLVAGDGCTPDCRREGHCGDGRIDFEEMCDDGNLIDGDGCSGCQLDGGYCGDGIAQMTEECDDGNAVSGDGCSDACVDERPAGLCAVVDAEHQPVRTSVIEQKIENVKTVYTEDLYRQFQTHCQPCHTDLAQGDFQVKLATMADDFVGFENSAIALIETDDMSIIMPPTGEPWSERAPDDPVRQLSSQLQAWIEQGKPDDAFSWIAPDLDGDDAGYAISETLSAALTNIGSCIPDENLYQRDQHRSQKMDALFADMNELPKRLSETDLTSLDSAELAKVGVLSYAPGYTLWADNAKKMRYFKLPFKTKIGFDESTQLFELPENTRVYKTFLKKVIDLEGKESYRKIETRLIVVRNDEIQADGTASVRALFGTYAWNEAETEAYLVTDPLRSGEPFADRILIYDVDEPGAAYWKENPPSTNLLQKLLQTNLVRHYAIPGSQRCVQCHMGSVEQNFIVGFSPVQLLRRPVGEGGVIEPSYPSELTQLQRFIALEIFEGLESEKQVQLLEAPQSSTLASDGGGASERPPRTEYEVIAQGYMLGNCAHCHNPRGYPSLRAPEIRDLLNFHPFTKNGGIFEFPLDRVSPRNNRKFAREGEIPIPYVSPSPYELHQRLFGGPEEEWEDGWFMAPWRSLIYRNVDTPYTYVSPDNTIFPHMPMHTPGYDCRVRGVMAKWMFSIPARRTEPGLKEVLSNAAQPWEEVFPGDADYGSAELLAAERIANYEATSLRNAESCVEEFPSILDPFIVIGSREEPEPNTFWGNIPKSSHFTPYDFTEPTGDWIPRRADWADVLVDGDLTCREKDCETSPAFIDQKAFLDVLDDIRVDDELRNFALTEIPLGFWDTAGKDACRFDGIPTVDSLSPKDRWEWMPPSSAEPLYYEAPGSTLFKAVCANCHGRSADSDGIMAVQLNELTGGNSRVANFRKGIFGPEEQWGQNIDRVFGPYATDKVSAEDWAARYLAWMSLGGTQSTIHSAILQLVNATKVLGKSRKGIPKAEDANMLNLAKNMCEALLPVGADNNLEYWHPTRDYPTTSERTDDGDSKLPIIRSTADSELWHDICSYNNPLPIRILRPAPDDKNKWIDSKGKVETGERMWALGRVGLEGTNTLVRRFKKDGSPTVPATAKLGTLQATIEVGLQASNHFPWCVQPPLPEYKEIADAAVAKYGIDGEPLPYCPVEWFDDAGKLREEYKLQNDEIRQWVLHGAANAGVILFTYMQELLKGNVKLPIDYDKCEELEGAK